MDLNEFLQAPRESLNIELKSWIDPTTPEGKAKIIKAAIALRNLNGGYLGIGISDDGTPLVDNAPPNLVELFHQDTIQALITKHSSEPFEVTVEFGSFQNSQFPFIVIPSGVRTPVAAKARLQDDSQRDLVKQDAVYVRTLGSNHTPSTAIARYSDWPQIMSACFDNREADIGHFVRRHLSGLNINAFAQLLSTEVPIQVSVVDAYLNDCRQYFNGLPRADNYKYLGKGFFEVAFVIVSQPERKGIRADDNFLSSFIYANPSHTGWPLWMDSRGFREGRARPRTRAGGWEAFLEDYIGNLILPHLDFWRVEPPGRFYHICQLTDDLIAIKDGKEPDRLFAMDFAISFVAEAISVAIAFANSMGYPAESTTLDFAFRWSGLQGRQLTTYDSGPYVSPGRVSGDDEVLSHLNVSLDLSPTSIPSLVPDVVGELFSAFGGMVFPKQFIEKIAAARLSRRYS